MSIFFGSSTITDWLQALGAIGVFYTLFLQYKSNQQQKKQMRISLIPKFKMKYYSSHNIFKENYIDFEYEFTLERNLAYDVSIEIVDSGDSICTSEIVNQNMQDGDDFSVNFQLEELFQPAYLVCNLYFSDVLGNNYTQNIRFLDDTFSASESVK